MFGPTVSSGKVKFSLWAPYQERASVEILGNGIYDMVKDDMGFFSVEVATEPNSLYKFLIKEGKVPDPASRYQPQGVHGYSQVVSPDFPWTDQGWRGVNKDELVIYELHVGTFSEEGTFKGVINKLSYLKDLGVTAIELMPVAQFPGSWGWGYDGVYPFAVQNSYGRPQDLKELVNQAHSAGISVVLDVVYNHVGPEGNYMPLLGPYLTDKYKTPWGLTFNFDDMGSDQVRALVLENLEYWMGEFHIDGFRLDAVHAIVDNSPKHILEDIADLVHSRGKVVIAESDLNDPRIVSPKDICGYNLDAQWVDDFHHSVHAYLTGEREGYFSDFGSLEDLVKALRDVFVYDGRYSKFRGKTHGRPIPPQVDRNRFVVYVQNHDQVGNRGGGERLSTLVDLDKYKVAAAIYLLSPFVPMIFMGEEYGERNPFYYFSDFSDQKIAQGVREGRRRDNSQVTDPQSRDTFLRSKLSWSFDQEILSFYRELIRIRKIYRPKGSPEVRKGDGWLQIKTGNVLSIFTFSENSVDVTYTGKLLLSSVKFPEIIEPGTVKLKRGVGVYKIEESLALKAGIESV
ncbi:malto-oligosyltrehalose trehalohydrolase [Metallosphaera tengchongensis]|uniref:Malto-oligosyltrehalose trehalohydrolase n=1 Tax=Metallosphaera tengchongensis TaxID=1532350 RepID=A0A6N0NUX7_9CREN|nr:malto-oligosyltrehalose trehalohydrolase [Metallosphaera tengchongensis]QKQ98999.1 malto-oligosyltrehalose trehalohydrolase [Metallosphaera tengchongensis]